MEKETILVVDDLINFLNMSREQLEKWGYNVLTAQSGFQALDILKSASVDLILSDQSMPEMDGTMLLNKVKELYNNIPFIIVTGHGNIPDAVMSIMQGADDYITKPCNFEHLKKVICRCLQCRRLTFENKNLKETQVERYGFQNIVADSPQMRKAVKLASTVAQSPYTTVAIYGESGTGKELFAHAIHVSSGCVGKFVGLNCAGIPPGLIESELFGHVKGAFTGADKDREGKLGIAREGTILLDEIGDMSHDIQIKMLRFLQERVYEKVGSDQLIKSNIRVIAATHQKLDEMILSRKFRKDLYHRINVFPISLPPLRERITDIPLLTNHFIKQFRHELGKPIPGISHSAMELLLEYRWPGNVRELKNQIERAVILSEGELIKPYHLNLGGEKNAEIMNSPLVKDKDKIRICFDFAPDDFSLDALTNRTLEYVLEQCGGNKARAAELLKINRKMFYRRNQEKIPTK